MSEEAKLVQTHLDGRVTHSRSWGGAPSELVVKPLQALRYRIGRQRFQLQGGQASVLEGGQQGQGPL